MAWQARLTSVNVNLDKTVDALKMTVEFFHEDERKTTKTYIIYLDELETVSLPALRAQVQADIDRLIKLDQVKTALESRIGTII